MAEGSQFRRATSLEKKLGQKLRSANESIPPMTLCSRSWGSARMATLMSRALSSAMAGR